MTWNEPGKSDNKDPWTGKQRGNKSPPELDVLIKKLIQKITARLQGQRTGSSQPTPSTSPIDPQAKWIIFASLGGLLLLWLLIGFFIVEPASMGVISRFGKYSHTVEPGLHWIPRFIETKQIINEQKISSYAYD